MHDRSDITDPRFPDLRSVKTAIEQGKILRDEFNMAVVEIGDVIIKYGRRVFKSEALAMQLVRDSTTVPAPRVYAYFSELFSNGKARRGYLVMEKVPGIPLVDALPRLSEAFCDKIALQLKAHISALRAISGRGKWGIVGREGVFHGGHFHYLHRPFTQQQLRYGNPCMASSAKDVFEYFAKASDDDDGGRDPKVAKLLPHVDVARPPIFSHGDLVPENVMVDEASGSITSIIDWEHAGWYPYFWDDSIAEIRKSAYQDAPVTTQRWEHIRRVAIGNAADEKAVDAFCTVHFLATVRGQDELPHDPCSCCF